MRARVAVTGSSGQLGRQLVAAFESAGHEVRALPRAEFDITDQADVDGLRAWGPDIVVNSAAWTDVDGCAREPDRAMRVNGDAAGLVARAAASCDALAVQISTNEVFDGRAAEAYPEHAEPNPINAYGRSKLAGERAVAAASPRHLVVRTAWLFGPGGTNFVTKILAAARRAAESGAALRLVEDETGNPTWTPDLARAIVDMTVDRPRVGVVHAAGMPPVSRLEWAMLALQAAEVAADIEPVPLASFERASTPPLHAVLAPSAGVPAMDWRAATQAYVTELLRSPAAG